MRYKITRDEFDRIESLMNQALEARNKENAKKYSSQIPYVVIDLAGGARNIVSELVSSITTASGRVSDKDRKIYFCHMDLYKLKSFIE